MRQTVFMDKIGRRIRFARKQAKLTQAQLAERLGLTKSAISQWEGDRTLPELPYLVGVCKVLHASSDYILFGREPDKLSQEVITLAQRISMLDSKKRELLVAIFAT